VVSIRQTSDPMDFSETDAISGRRCPSSEAPEL
jgi:hypothetical protein